MIYWSDRILEKLERLHDVYLEEVEEALHDDPRMKVRMIGHVEVGRRRYKRYQYVGKTLAGRLLQIYIDVATKPTKDGPNVIGVTAYDAEEEHWKWYERK